MVMTLGTPNDPFSLGCPERTDSMEVLMISRSLKCLTRGLLAATLAATLLASPNARAQGKDELHLDKIPKKVMDTLTAKFPKTTIHKWTQEKEGEFPVYDFEFDQEGWKFEADIMEDGTILKWEMEIPAEELPEAVANTVKKDYAGSTWKEIMQITAVKEGKDIIVGYEIVLVTADKKELEVTVAPDGKIVEDSKGESSEDGSSGDKPKGNES